MKLGLKFSKHSRIVSEDLALPTTEVIMLKLWLVSVPLTILLGCQREVSSKRTDSNSEPNLSNSYLNQSSRKLDEGGGGLLDRCQDPNVVDFLEKEARQKVAGCYAYADNSGLTAMSFTMPVVVCGLVMNGALSVVTLTGVQTFRTGDTIRQFMNKGTLDNWVSGHSNNKVSEVLQDGGLGGPGSDLVHHLSIIVKPELPKDYQVTMEIVSSSNKNAVKRRIDCKIAGQLSL